MGRMQDLLTLDLEYRLTIAVRLSDGDLFCPNYLVERREVLLPEILKKAWEAGEDPAEVFHKYAQRVHSKFCESDERL